MSKQIRDRLQEYKKDFDRDTQRGELLSRNEHFLKELDDMMGRFQMKEFLAFRAKAGRKEQPKKVPIAKITDQGVERSSIGYSFPLLDKIPKGSAEMIEDFSGLWIQFCDNWNIKPEWDGDISKLKDNLSIPVEIFWMEERGPGGPALLVKIDNWTILNDIRQSWSDIEKLQNEIWKKQEKNTNFTRDLCWHDLKNKLGLDLTKIAEIWAEMYPQDVDLLVLRRIKREIDRKVLRGRALTDEELLREITSGSLAGDYQSRFEGEREHYLTGKGRVKSGKRSKFNPPFADAIKKAISRMDQQIKGVGIASLKTSIDIEQVLRTGRSFVRR